MRVFGNFFVLLFLVMQGLDGALSYVGICFYGVAPEGNPLIEALMFRYGPVPTLIGAKSIAAACGIILHLTECHRWVASFVALYFLLAVAPWCWLLFA